MYVVHQIKNNFCESGTSNRQHYFHGCFFLYEWEIFNGLPMNKRKPGKPGPVKVCKLSKGLRKYKCICCTCSLSACGSASSKDFNI